MIETTAGLPNTCSKCGQPAGPTWFAPHVDAALAGAGLCAACHAEAESASGTPAPAPAAPAISAEIPAPASVPAAETPSSVPDEFELVTAQIEKLVDADRLAEIQAQFREVPEADKLGWLKAQLESLQAASPASAPAGAPPKKGRNR